MKAAVVEEIGKPLVVHADWPDPDCGATDAVIRVEANGLCLTDHHIWHGGWPWAGLPTATPIVLGHEYCGVVEEVGREVTRFRPGDRVVAPFNHACGVCEQCMAGNSHGVCLDVRFPMFHYTGGFGRLTKVSRADLNLVALPGNVSFVEAASIGCRFMTSWHGLVDQARVTAGEWVAVFGCGGVGLAAVNIARALGANVIAVSRTKEKLELARSLGAEAAVTAGPDAVTAIKELTRGGAHVSVDALGDEETMLPALYCLRPKGRLLRLGTCSKKQQGLIAMPVDLIVFQELEIVGSLGMQAARYPAMLRMVESGKVTPGKLVSGTVTIEEAGPELARMGDYQSIGTRVIDRW
ncbi:MAG TPA: alcohol dehydrogenase [Solibacterales bacterium]|nr:alcohol dehydrogenase [Bryobacterales bacterium]